MSVTLLDIARIAKVSESAVSRALHDHPRISEATRDRIKKIAADLEFDFNSQAQALSTQRSGTIGIILPNYGAAAHRTYYLDLLINDIRSELSRSGYDLLVADSAHTGPLKSNLRRLVLQRKVDALVLIIAELHDLDRQILTKRKIPVVMVNSKPLELADLSLDEFPSFYTDNIAGGRLAAEHLLKHRCQKVLCLADRSAGPEMVDRTVGFTRAAAEAGVSVTVLECGSSFDLTYRFVHDHAAQFQQADGVFCHTDLMACALLRSAQDLGIAVPSQLKVVGYDDIELGTYFSPGLTTIHQPREEIARQACRQIMAQLAVREAGPVVHVCLPPSLVSRGSA